MSLATPQAFANDPNNVWQFYHMRREKALKAVPNAAHLALATLSIQDHLRTIAPRATFTLITQNVDGLSKRALEAVQNATGKSSTETIEMHGTLFDTLCTVCGLREANFDSPICPSLSGTELLVEHHETGPQIPLEELPRCRECRGLLRPGVVWFGEIPHHMEKINKLIDEADLALIVGTSSTVYPAAAFASDISDNGGKTAVFNLARSNGDEDADFLFIGACEEMLPSILFGVEATES
ncbi:DHS-like NAD/FAD-binding domain-containing protein [Ramaria rubella]|nr:DHS-like NAD/FAD-binding domain-containing protein [Ramaria rubella]